MVGEWVWIALLFKHRTARSSYTCLHEDVSTLHLTSVTCWAKLSSSPKSVSGVRLQDDHPWRACPSARADGSLYTAVGLVLHLVAFEPVIESQASDEQQAFWLPKVRQELSVRVYPCS